MTARREVLAIGTAALVGVLSATAAAAAALPVVQADHPDAELLAACAAFDELERAYIATDFEAHTGSPEDIAAEAGRDCLRDAQDPLLARMVELRATTREGMMARARSLILWDGEVMQEDGPLAEFTNTKLTRAVLRDLLAWSAGA